MSVAATALAGTPVAVSDSRARHFSATCAWAGVCLWLVAMPFEATQPLVRLPGQSISSAEAAIFLVLAVWGSGVIADACAIGLPAVTSVLRTPLTWPWVVFLAAMLASALAAGAEQANAVHMAARFVLAFGVFLVAAGSVTSLRQFESVFLAAVVSGAVVSVLAALEFVGVPAVLRMLTAFRPGIAVVGAQVRSAGPFQYPTIASMYLEILFALGLALVPMALDRGRVAFAVGIAASLALISEAVVLSFTRSGLITIGIALAIVAAWRFRARGRIRDDKGMWAIAGIAVILGLELLSSRSADAMRLRMSTEEQENWFSATFDVPASLALATGAIATVPVTLTNGGLTTWDSTAAQPFRLSYHWLLPDEDRSIDFDGLRTDFPGRVAPGASLTMQARVRAPRQPGRYRLMWDVVEEHRLWFSAERDAELFVTGVNVTGAPTGSIGAPLVVTLPKGPARPGRFRLWAAAGRMWLDHPWLGVGPDSFRLLYGPYAQIANPDPRVHSNNMYIEVLVDAGLVGFVAFTWFGWRVLALLFGLARSAPSGDAAMVAAAITGAIAAVAVHGIVDSFFSFTATYVLFAVILGLLVAAGRLVPVHAHRV